MLTTNAFLGEMLPQTGILPARGQVLVTRPIEGLKLFGTFHFNQGFYYWRHLPGNRILLGGGRNLDIAGETTTEHGLNTTIENGLLRFLQHHLLPEALAEHAHQLVDQQWSGHMAMTTNHQPAIYQYANVYAACCCNGMGVALSPIFAESLAQKLLA